jgi:hypothetical protein
MSDAAAFMLILAETQQDGLTPETVLRIARGCGLDMDATQQVNPFLDVPDLLLFRDGSVLEQRPDDRPPWTQLSMWGAVIAVTRRIAATGTSLSKTTEGEVTP